MIDYPDLEQRNEEQLAAEAIAITSGGLTEAIVNAQIAERREMLALIQAGLDVPVCPELTNANPSSPHTVILEAFAWLLGQQAYKFNQVPQQVFIAFANLFGITPRIASAAVTTLRFTVSTAPTGDTVVNIPLGTEVSTVDGQYVFITTEAKSRTGNGIVDVAAQRTVNGHTLLKPNLLTKMIDSVAFVSAVTNLNAIDSGTELESLDATLSRVSQYQRRGERIVSTKDLEDAILFDGLLGNGIVRAFPYVVNGDFGGELKPGYTTVVVMTKTGDIIDATTAQRIAALLDTVVGNQFIYAVNPSYVSFDVEASVLLNTGAPSQAVLDAIETNLRNFYAASRENFGRPIDRSEIIAVIEGTGGVDRIVSGAGDPIIASPLVDTTLLEYQLPLVGTVTINVV